MLLNFKVTFAKMETLNNNKSAVVEAVNATEEYVEKLADLLNSLSEAEKKVQHSAKQAEADINDAFSSILTSFGAALQKRRTFLLKEVDRLCAEGLAPLKACRELIDNQMKIANNYGDEGRLYLLRGDEIASAEGCEGPHSYAERSASVLGRLPEVPNLEDVPDVQFELPLNEVERELELIVENTGSVSRLGPVQICAAEEKPGALLVHWQQVETEKQTDIGAFRLQRAHGDVRGRRDLETNYHDEYVGPECQHLVRNLRPEEPITLRVCCCGDGEQAPWSPWSIPYVASTSLPPFCWDEANPNYTVTNEKQLASKITSEPSILFSSARQFGPGHAVELTILECGAGCSDEGLALSDHCPSPENLLVPGVIFINAQGSVFLDGKEKTTKLPSFEKGSKVTFTCEHIRDSKIRIHIDNNNKTVAYDWNVNSPEQKLYFAICFGQEGWKVLVE